ncbi:NAD(P)-binding domain-containing protein, partial [Calditrichota bacterium]
MKKETYYDIGIIGAGPAGIGCALTAKKENLKTVMIDKGNIVNSIIGFPQNMTFFSTADLLELNNIPFTSTSFRPTRNETIKYYQGIVKAFKLPFILDSNVQTITKVKSGFKIEYLKNGKLENIQSRAVIIATGFYDNPNKLNIPGEDLPHVSHYYSEPFSFFGKKVIVVGGKNSAVEAALELYRFGAEVTMVHRKAEIKENVKYWILPDIQNRIKAGEIKIFLNAELKEIQNNMVVINSNGKLKSVSADA